MTSQAPESDSPTSEHETPAGPSSTRDGLRVYLAIPLTLLLFNMAFFLPRNMLTNYMTLHDLGRWSGLVLAILPLMTLLLAVPVGLLGDRFSPKRLAVIGLSLLVAFTALFFFHRGEPTLTMLVAAFIVGGAAAAVGDSSLRPLYLKCIGHRRQALKLALLSTAPMLGFGGSAFLGGLAARHLGWNLDQQFRLAFPMAIAALAVSLVMKDAQPTPFSLAAYRASLMRRKVLVYMAVVFVNAMHFGTEAVCIAPYVKDHLGMGDAGAGDYFGLIAVAMTITGAASAAIRDRGANRHRMWTLGLLFSAVFNVASVLVASPAWFFGIRIGHVVADAIMLNAALRIVATLFPRNRVGGPMGLSALVSTCGVLVGTLVSNEIRIAGFIPTAWQLPAPFILAGAAVLTILVVQRLMKERF
ncbi:MAG: MFS transporter [Planctomycetes bacterium]|nr:MFS transporter [Planctomycetota bacterium]